MKLRLYSLLPLRQALLLGGAILLLSWLYTQSTAVEPQTHLTFVNAVRTIKQLDANLNQDVLRARYNLLVHYDSFVATQDQIEVQTNILNQAPFAGYLDTLAPNLSGTILALKRAADSKAALIERFKSDNAVLKNSLHYFPLVTGQLIEHCAPARLAAFCRDAEQLQRALLVFNLYGNPDMEADIQRRLNRIRAHLPSLPAALAEEAATVVNHTENILRTRRGVDHLTTSILSSPLAVTAENLSRIYDNAHGQAMQRSGNYRLLLYAFSVLLLGYVFYSVARIKLGAMALENANHELQGEVRQRQRAQDRLMVYQQTINGANDAIALLDPQLRFEEANAAHCRLIERGETSMLLGTALTGLLSESDTQRLMHAIQQSGAFRGEVAYRLPDGKSVDVEMALFALGEPGTVQHYVTILRDVSEHKAHLTALKFQATHDALTGLANRVLLYSRLEQVTRDKAAGLVCLMLLDLDRFKEINDTLGHHAGDMVLREIGNRIDSVIQGHGLIARLGGDEFAVLLPQIAHSGQALQIASRILSALRPPIELTGLAVEISGSIGIALSPEHGDTPSELMRCADVAMYLAKNNGLGWALYDPEQDQHNPRRLAIMTGLGQAIEQDQLLLHFQPKLALDSGKVSGFEALVRWRHPEHGMIPPDQFIPLAEMSDLIGPLTLWVVDKALAQVRQWQSSGLEASVAVNFSARNFLDDKLPQKLGALLSKHGVAHHLLEVEITESTMMADPARSLVIMRRIHDMGLHLSIDDFGTGHSSLAYLRRLPIRALKIDLSFVRDMRINKENELIVHSTIQLAHNLGLNVIAEGVEDEATLAQLRAFGCDEAQGYFISRPMEAEQASAWLAARQTG